MPLAKSSGGSDFKPMPSGSHVGRCISVISLGTQDSPLYPASFKVMLIWEVPGETIEINGKPAPMTISREYTLSLSEKANLRHDLESWRGRVFTKEELDGFDVSKVLGQPCMLSVIHKTNAKGKVYGAVSNVVGLPKGVPCPPAWHPLIGYEIEDGKNEVYKAFPDWIKNKIAACEEWSGPTASSEPDPTHVQSDPDPECPF